MSEEIRFKVEDIINVKVISKVTGEEEKYDRIDNESFSCIYSEEVDLDVMTENELIELIDYYYNQTDSYYLYINGDKLPD